MFFGGFTQVGSDLVGSLRMTGFGDLKGLNTRPRSFRTSAPGASHTYLFSEAPADAGFISSEYQLIRRVQNITSASAAKSAAVPATSA